METSASPPPPATELLAGSTKRKRSPSLEALSQPTPPPPTKTARPNPSQLQINYLARQSPKILPLITTEDPLPSLLQIINDYDAVLQRHESMAGNMGARPLGPILIQRFERLFDGPPRVLKAHGKENVNIGWLDVVEFARSKPDQFNLEKMRDGVRVCQFYTKQCRVEVSEEDYVLIASGMPQRLIPPQPIEEDEEKELGTLEILEKKLGAIVQLADQVSARARQLNHRLKNRRSAIISRRETEAIGLPDEELRSPRVENGEPRASVSPTSGFTAVNSRPPLPNGQPAGGRLEYTPSSAPTNGAPSSRGASAATRAELLGKFHTNSEREALSFTTLDLTRSATSPSHGGIRDPGAGPVTAVAAAAATGAARPSLHAKSRSKGSEGLEYPYPAAAAGPVAIPNTPTSLLPFAKPSPAERYDDSGPYKGDMMLRMEQLNRGDRVQPPCDRCRRLHMDCLKNLTACMGCTKKHAKCSWKDVDPQELKDHPFVPRVVLEGANPSGSGGTGGGEKSGSDGEGIGEGGDGGSRGGGKGRNITSRSSSTTDHVTGKKDWSALGKSRAGEVRDEELLGESSDEDDPDAVAISAMTTTTNLTGAVPALIARDQVKGTREQDHDGSTGDGGIESTSPVVNGTTNASTPLTAPKDSPIPPQTSGSSPTPMAVTASTATSAAHEGDFSSRKSAYGERMELDEDVEEADRPRASIESGAGSGSSVLGIKGSGGTSAETAETDAEMEARIPNRGGMRWDESHGRMMLDV